MEGGGRLFAIWECMALGRIKTGLKLGEEGLCIKIFEPILPSCSLDTHFKYINFPLGDMTVVMNDILLMLALLSFNTMQHKR